MKLFCLAVTEILIFAIFRKNKKNNSKSTATMTPIFYFTNRKSSKNGVDEQKKEKSYGASFVPVT